MKTNEQIIEEVLKYYGFNTKNRSDFATYVIRRDQLDRLCDSVRSAFAPPVGSGSWAILQHLLGESVRYEHWSHNLIWLPNKPYDSCMGLEALLSISGWVIVLDKTEHIEKENQENNLFCKINELKKRLEKLEKKPKQSVTDDLKKSQNIPEGWTTTRRGGLRQLGVYDG